MRRSGGLGVSVGAEALVDTGVGVFARAVPGACADCVESLAPSPQAARDAASSPASRRTRAVRRAAR